MAYSIYANLAGLTRLTINLWAAGQPLYTPLGSVNDLWASSHLVLVRKQLRGSSTDTVSCAQDVGT